MISCNNFKLL